MFQIGLLSSPFYVVGGLAAVDSFLVISGFLLAYQGLKKLHRDESINWTKYYIRRYIRFLLKLLKIFKKYNRDYHNWQINTIGSGHVSFNDFRASKIRFRCTLGNRLKSSCCRNFEKMVELFFSS